jgi:hypothetical protein
LRPKQTAPLDHGTEISIEELRIKMMRQPTWAGTVTHSFTLPYTLSTILFAIKGSDA